MTIFLKYLLVITDMTILANKKTSNKTDKINIICYWLCSGFKLSVSPLKKIEVICDFITDMYSRFERKNNNLAGINRISKISSVYKEKEQIFSSALPKNTTFLKK